MLDAKIAFDNSMRTKCKEGELDMEDIPKWTKKAIAKHGQEAVEEVEARNAFTNSVSWRSHFVGQEGRRGAFFFLKRSVSTASERFLVVG